MILKGSQRAGGTQLGLHLLRTDENDHVKVHEIRGFVSGDPVGAFKEAYAVSRGTRCKQFLFSLSLSPPERENVAVSTFEKAIADIETKLGLNGQPRVVVFHEKEGRRHAHCVWSRIKVDTMTAVNLPHFKLKLRDISRQLYLENDWQMPEGLVNSQQADPLNFTIAEWQQAKRTGQDPRALKEAFQDCWAISDSLKSFSNALKERGLYLARGDRRGFVALDWRGEIYAVSRLVGVRSKDVSGKLGQPDQLPSVAQTRERLGKLYTDKTRSLLISADKDHDEAISRVEAKRRKLVAGQRFARLDLEKRQAERKVQETRRRANRLPTGIKALWFRLTGKYRSIKKRNEAESRSCAQRDAIELENLIISQLRERQSLQHEKRLIRHRHVVLSKKLQKDLKAYMSLGTGDHTDGPGLAKTGAQRRRRRSR
ncbi:hypothetical protein ACSSV1_004906 [Labrenzia sp. MBR-25]